MNFKIFGLLVCLTLVHTISAARYALLHPAKFPIGMWVSPPDSFRNEAQFKKMADCGITFVNGFAPHENSTAEVMKVLDLCAQNDMLYFVNRASTHYSVLAHSDSLPLPREFVEGLKPYVSHPAFAGELLFDEPGKPLFKNLAAFIQQFEKNFGHSVWHVNLFPSYATGGIRTHSYEEYIDSWIREVNPPCLSYDSYPLLASGGIIDDYFYNLDLIRAKSLQANIPFWTFIQTLSIANTPGVPDKREPSGEDIRWQVWSNLAFGSKGIQYFCYWTPGNGAEIFTDALISRNGTETPRYTVVQSLNREVQYISQWLLNSDPVGILQHSSTPYKLYIPSPDKAGPLHRITGDDVIAGCFRDSAGKMLFLICPLRPDKGADLTVHFDDKIRNVMVAQGLKSTAKHLKKGQLKLKIKQGDAVLLYFNE